MKTRSPAAALLLALAAAGLVAVGWRSASRRWPIPCPAALGWFLESGIRERLLPTPWIVVSFSDEGFHDPEDLKALLAEKGHVDTVAIDSKRYVGAQIGIHSPSGAKVGTVSHLRNKELLFVAGPSPR